MGRLSFVLGAALLPVIGSSLLATLPLRPLAAQRAPRRVELTIAATTDVHGRLRAWDYNAGAPDPTHSLAAAATIVDSARKANPDGVVLVEGGDILQGNPLLYVAARVRPTPVHPVIAAMNVMRYDAAVLGNHEFNYGVPLLQKAIGQAGFPFVAANVLDAKGNPWVAPMAMVVRRGVRVAIIGGTTPGSMVWDRENLKAAGLTVTDIVPAVRARVQEARKRKADVVVVLLHSGLDGAASYDTVSTGLPSENVAGRVPREIDGIDVVVYGHSHRELVDSTINGALLMQPRNWAGSVALGTLALERQDGRWKVVNRQGRAVRVAGHKEHPEVLAAMRGTHEATVAWVNEPVGRTAAAWRADSARVVDMPITDLVNEVMRRSTGAELSATAAFTLDAGLDTGAITQAELSRLYPYDNTLRAVRISGAQLKAFLEHSARYYRTVGADGRAERGVVDNSVPGYNFDVVSGADYTIDLRQPIGQRITALTYRGKSVQPTDSFTMAVNNYRQGGGGGFSMLQGAPVVFDKDLDIRQLIIDEVRRVGTLDQARYSTRNWHIEPVAAVGQAYTEQTRGRGAEASGRAPASSTASTSGQRMVRVIASSDFHAALQPLVEQNNQRMGGAVAFSAAIRRAQRECVAPACLSIVVDGGDLFSGSPASDWDGGRPTTAVMSRMGITAGALGNHEFDFGQDTLRARLRELGYPMLAANVRGPDGKLPAWLRADTIVTRGTVRIGIVGAAGTHTPQTASRRKIGALTFVDPVPVFLERARALRAAGAQVVVAAIHDGGRCTSGYSGECTGGGIELAKRLAASGADRPDALVLGHSHTNVALDLDGMPAVQAASSGRSVLIIDMPLGGGAARTEVRPVRGDDVEGAAPGVDSIVAVSIARVQQRLQQPVATIAEPMVRDGGQNPMGNMLADAMRSAARADVGMWNNGGIRANLQAGPLNYGGVHYVTPFGNTVAVVRVRGRDLVALFEQAVQGTRPNIHISGFTVEFDAARPRGARVVRANDTQGQPLDSARIYTVAMNDFMAENEYSDILRAAVSTQFLNVRDIDAVSEFLRSQPQPVRGDATARIRAIPPGSK